MKNLILMLAALLAPALASASETHLSGPLIIESYGADTSCGVATGAGDLCLASDLVVVGDFAGTGDLTLSGGAGALTFSGSASSVVVDDDDSTALLIGSTGQLNLLTLDTTDNAETVVVTGTTTTDALHVDIGTALFDEGISAPAVATHLETIRFCGNGADGATPQYIGPVLLDDTEADLAFGGSGCDGLDDPTEATADEPWHAGFAFKPVAMACVGVCTGTSAADDAAVYQLRDDTADVTGMTCTAPAFGDDDTPSQCVVRDSTPATVAAGSTVAIEVTLTDDDCNDVGDDFECLVYVSFE